MTSSALALPTTRLWRAYLELCKPRIVALMLLTAVAGMLMATPWEVTWQTAAAGIVGIALSAGAGAALNHVIDRRLDAAMARTEHRPIPAGLITTQRAIAFALALGVAGFVLLASCVNLLTATLTVLTLIAYAVIYTVFLKRATPQNIVIGGIAGAMPPLLGWTAVTQHVDPGALLLSLIIFVWTPAHFWPLAIYRCDDYRAAKIPMLPVTHGVRFTALCVLLYTWLLCGVTLLPFAVGMSGGLYLAAALGLNSGFLYWAFRLRRSGDTQVAWKMFRFSIIYLAFLFTALLTDHFIAL